jgi:hypothetical protein
MVTKLTMDDIVDLRAYERERDDFRSHVIELKKQRRVTVGPIVSLVFENRDTIRFQIQEMARAERMLRDEQIRGELDAYNPLIPEPGQLSATLFIELTSKDELMEWLPKLVGIERSVELTIGSGDGAEVVRSAPEEGHAAQLTREEITPAVHYVRFELSGEQIDRFARETVAVGINHPAYREVTLLGEATKSSLLADLQNR